MREGIVKTILRDFALSQISYDVYVIANTRDKTTNFEPDRVVHASPDEFFSREEFSEIASAIFDVFGYAKVFYSEVEFFQYIIRHDIKRDECLVYNLARDGKGEGKKSLVPAICDLLNLRYTGSNAFVISLLRNKYLYSHFLEQFKVPVPKSWLFDCKKGFVHGEPPSGTRVIVKDIHESASIGLTNDNVLFYHADEASKERISRCCARMASDKALVQEFISGSECEVLVLESNEHYTALDPVKINIQNGEIIDSETSNDYRYSFCLLSSEFPARLCEQIQRYAENAAELLGIQTYARFDFRIDKKQNCFLIDIAGTPYTIRHSSVAYLFQDAYQLKYKDIYKVVVYLALCKKEIN